MKNIIRSLVIFLLAIFTLSSCEVAQPGVPADGSGGTTNPGGGTQTGTSKVTFKLDGVSKIGENLDASYDKVSNVLTFDCEVKNGSKTEGLSLIISNFNGAKTYSAASDDVIVLYTNDISSDKSVDLFVGVSGNFMITSITDKLVTGTFQFEVMNENLSKKQITQGSFSVDLSSSDSGGPITITPTPEVDTEMTFKLDGVSKEAFATTSSYNESLKLLIITGTVAGAINESISFSLGGFVGSIKTYNNVAATYNPDITKYPAEYKTNTAEVVVTKLDSISISGTFKFDAKSDATGITKKITEGKFTVAFTK